MEFLVGDALLDVRAVAAGGNPSLKEAKELLSSEGEPDHRAAKLSFHNLTKRTESKVQSVILDALLKNMQILIFTV